MQIPSFAAAAAASDACNCLSGLALELRATASAARRRSCNTGGEQLRRYVRVQVRYRVQVVHVVYIRPNLQNTARVRCDATGSESAEHAAYILTEIIAYIYVIIPHLARQLCHSQPLEHVRAREQADLQHRPRRQRGKRRRDS